MKELKKFILEALLRTEGIPMSDEALDRACRQALTPRPLQTDIDRAKRELEEAKYLSGNRDEIEGVTWTLTDKGTHKAKQY